MCPMSYRQQMAKLGLTTQASGALPRFWDCHRAPPRPPLLLPSDSKTASLPWCRQSPSPMASHQCCLCGPVPRGGLILEPQPEKDAPRVPHTSVVQKRETEAQRPLGPLSQSVCPRWWS